MFPHVRPRAPPSCAIRASASTASRSPGSANGGSFTRLRSVAHDVGSLYQLRDAQLARGVPSHWTPYVRVNNADEAAAADGAALGPFCHLRPLSQVGAGVRIGIFVELKKSRFGRANWVVLVRLKTSQRNCRL